MISKNVTVIVTTSPSRSDPELTLLESTFSSLALVGLDGCRRILICDHFDVGAEHAKRKDHGGRLPLDRIERYRNRLARFRAAEWAAGVEVVELEEWHGFGLAVKFALGLVTTPLVCVVQHDLTFRRSIDLCPVVDLLLNETSVNYVYFKRDSQRHYRLTTLDRHRLELGPPVCFPTSRDSVSLTRLPRFFDGTHVARTGWYEELFKVAFEGRKIKRGQFIDTTLGLWMLNKCMEEPQLVEVGNEPGSMCQISQGVLNFCEEFGCWMWSGEEEPLIQHLNGRTLMSSEEAKLVEEKRELATVVSSD